MDPRTGTTRNERIARAATRRRRLTVLRCECSICSVHFRVEAGLVVSGGNCPNCGSYAYEPICVEPRGPNNPWTWRLG